MRLEGLLSAVEKTEGQGGMRQGQDGEGAVVVGGLAGFGSVA